MRLFKKHVTPITLVNNDEVYFIIQGGSGEGRISEPFSFDRLLQDESVPDAVPEAFRRRGNRVMVVPDYWLGNSSFAFQSRKRSLAEAFLERKLQAEFPEVHGITDFFAYFLYTSEEGEPSVSAYFVREPTFFHLYRRLAEWGLQPHRITAPAFLWESQLKERIPDFRAGGKAFVHLVSNECFLYFFFNGHFLFSRQISLPEVEADASEQLDTLTYETNQSLHLFSQKAKAEIDKIYMVSFGHVDARDLAERIGRDVEAVSGLEEELVQGTTTIGHPGLLRGLYLPNLGESGKWRTIGHRREEKEQQWRPVQKVGIAVGLILLLLLAGESVLLWNWARPVRAQAAPGSTAEARQAEADLRQYNEALDLFLKETRRPSASKTIINLARALPENVWIREMTVETEPSPGVALKGAVRAAKPAQFRRALSELLDNLDDSFQGARSLGMQDIDFNADNCTTEEAYHSCIIALKFGLP